MQVERECEDHHRAAKDEGEAGGGEGESVGSEEGDHQGGLDGVQQDESKMVTKGLVDPVIPALCRTRCIRHDASEEIECKQSGDYFLHDRPSPSTVGFSSEKGRGGGSSDSEL